MKQVKTLPRSDFFTLEQLADGVYAAIAVAGKGAFANSGIVDLGDATLVFDTFATPQAAEELRQAAVALTGRDVTYVVNSHEHFDHVHGNQVFTGATVIATELTREIMAVRRPAMLEYAKSHPEFLDGIEAAMKQEQDPIKRKEMAEGLGEYRAVDAALPILEIHLPTVTFTDKMILRGTRRTVEVITYGGGHSPSDAFLYLPEEKIAFMADLLFVKTQPSMGNSVPESWIEILDRVQQLDVQTWVPGHGNVGGLEDLLSVRRYLQDMVLLAQEVVVNGGSLEKHPVAIPEPYQTWDWSLMFYENMKFLLGRSAQ